MKRMFLISCLLAVCAWAGNAQKYALIDMEYILKNIPAYEMTNEQRSHVSKLWQNEVEALPLEAENMYTTYQSDLVFLSAEMKSQREEEIVKKEQEAQDLKRKYFGADGELYKKRASLMKPIQDDRQRDCRRPRLPDCGRPSLGYEHHFRIAEDRYQQ